MSSIKFDRILKAPTRSFFLLGPRATGKSTWLKAVFSDAFRIDLLDASQYYPLSRQPSLFRQIVLAQSIQKWIVVDEVQRIPELLNEVHSLMEDHGYQFVLTGSSARKLRAGKANMLAGRAIVKNFFPLVFPEWKAHNTLDEVSQWGSLPGVLAAPPSDRIELLEAYTGTYLKEEIQEEALTRRVQNFSRFLQGASLTHGQITNLSNIARDAAVPRSTVSVYYAILVDTLIGHFLPAWQPKRRIKETNHPKFYFFDCGVLRSLQGTLRESIDPISKGILLETLIFQEILAYRSIRSIGGDFSYWRTKDGIEVDFIWTRGQTKVAIEVKTSQTWKSGFNVGLQTLNLQNSWGIYQGANILKMSWGFVLPVEEFLKKLWNGEILF
jgi:predicted AAA+ superfamily ATPase